MNRRGARERVAVWALPNEPAAAVESRQHATGQLAAWALGEDLTDTVALVVSELVTRAVRYGRPPLKPRLTPQDELTREVSDASATSPRLRHARTTGEGGRGLLVLAPPAQARGVRHSPTGKTTWPRQQIPPRRPDRHPTGWTQALGDDLAPGAATPGELSGPARLWRPR
ncbi:ATP-binding protein [Streptomyces griseus]|uniref:ATP-binding protein n=1 Tax=Streptomyces griseus TaxID=1911 RepID=UPI001112D4E6|nr:ATP-binding protein [Streptomyces griseus]